MMGDVRESALLQQSAKLRDGVAAPGGKGHEQDRVLRNSKQALLVFVEQGVVDYDPAVGQREPNEALNICRTSASSQS